MKDGSKLFIVSNRIPVTLSRDSAGNLVSKRSAGGLVTGLSDVHKQEGVYWVGFDGLFADSGADPALTEARAKLERERFLSVPIEQARYDGYYARSANGAIWPLFHYFPGFMRFSQEDWSDYVAVNRQFADAVLTRAKPGDRVWVHDYQLMLLPRMLRDAINNLKIAYFHHIPFPSSEMFRILPVRAEVLTGMLGADLIGFHTLEYARHFLTCVTRLLGAEVDKDSATYQRRPTKVGAFPLGVDVASTRRQASDPTLVPGMDELARSLAGKQVFVGIDRLDYTKGLPERLQAFRSLLQRHPEVVGNVVFVQVCVPSRQDAPFYAELRSEVERLVGQINGEFGRPGYAPLQYLFQPFSPEQVTAFYKIGDFMVVTPLRDGLNLVAKEFVAARGDDDGVLILSEFAGAAAEMGEALIVNPFDIEGVAEKMYEALTMPADERRRRMQALRKRITAYNNVEWAQDFQRAWTDSADRIPGSDRQHQDAMPAEIVAPLRKLPIKRLFLDYDGTLTPIRRTPEEAAPSAALKEALRTLAAREDVDLTLLTGRPRAFCDEHFSGFPMSFVAEHSAFFKRSGAFDWTAAFDQDEWQRIRGVVLPHLESFVRRIPASFIEEKETSIVLHYRKAEPVFAHAQALELKESLMQILSNTAYSAFRAKRAVEIKPAAANKGLAVERLLAAAPRAELPFLTAGDDLGDEAMFRVFPERNVSIHVGFGTSFARYRVDGPAALWEILDHLVAAPAGGPLTFGMEARQPWTSARSSIES